MADVVRGQLHRRARGEAVALVPVRVAAPPGVAEGRHIPPGADSRGQYLALAREPADHGRRGHGRQRALRRDDAGRSRSRAVRAERVRARISTRIVCPTSSVPSWRVWPLDVPLQPPPLVSQRRHWYVNAIGPAPLQVPDVAVTVSPCLTVPTIVGGDVFTGAPSVTTALGPETAFADPSEFDAVTETRSVCPASLLLACTSVRSRRRCSSTCRRSSCSAASGSRRSSAKSPTTIRWTPSACRRPSRSRRWSAAPCSPERSGGRPAPPPEQK